MVIRRGKADDLSLGGMGAYKVGTPKNHLF